MSIQQGNYLVTDSVSQLKEGMTRSQVRFLLGTPMVPDAFDDSRWDYYYFYNSRKFDKPLKRRLTVYFADERVQRVENQGVPTQTDLDQLEQDLQKAIARTRRIASRARGNACSATTSLPIATTTALPASKSAPAVEKDARRARSRSCLQPLPAPVGSPSGPP
jgi:outer membrane protein assembly factor BamE